jgi:hypothetical protein
LDRRRAGFRYAVTPDSPVADRRLARTESFRIAAVEIGAARQSECIGGREEAPHQRVGFCDIDDIDRAAPPARGRVRRIVILQSLEIRQKIGIAPAGLPPFIVFARMAAEIHHAVDRRTAAEYAAARHRQHPVIYVALRHRLVAPGQARIADGLRHHRRHVDRRVVIRRARFDQCDSDARFGGQPVGEHAAGGTGARDHVVEDIAHQPPNRVAM